MSDTPPEIPRNMDEVIYNELVLHRQESAKRHDDFVKANNERVQKVEKRVGTTEQDIARIDERHKLYWKIIGGLGGFSGVATVFYTLAG